MLVLPVGHHGPAGVAARVQGQPMAVVPDDVRAVVRMAFPIHALADAGVAQHLHGAPFQHPGANAGQNVGAGLALQHNAVNALQMQPLGEQQPGRPAADDGHGRFHSTSLRGGTIAAGAASRPRRSAGLGDPFPAKPRAMTITAANSGAA